MSVIERLKNKAKPVPAEADEDEMQETIDSESEEKNVEKPASIPKLDQ